MTFLDTGILVGALLENHSEHAQCRAALEESEAPFTDAHALAEAFATLTGFYNVPTAAAAELTLGLKSSMAIEALPLADYETAIGEARPAGELAEGGRNPRPRSRQSAAAGRRKSGVTVASDSRRCRSSLFDIRHSKFVIPSPRLPPSARRKALFFNTVAADVRL